MGSGKLQGKRNVRENVFNKTGGRCCFCGNYISPFRFDVDHTVSQKLGGNDDVDNFLPSCTSCNRGRHELTVDNYREELKMCMIERIIKCREYLDECWWMKQESYKEITQRLDEIENIITKQQILFYFEYLQGR